MTEVEHSSHVSLVVAVTLFVLAIGGFILLVVKSHVTYDPSVAAVNYARDPQTNLCFAWVGDHSEQITNVPCTPEVLRKLQK